ncbi:hypothetical protein KEM56_005032 [Ascosphaera pollenicola]|nr:hypothetical protein KEM56_005032 [Ascosphaera pollenicola]
MLARARQSNDLFYLILHQLYCALSLQPGRALDGLTDLHRDGINIFAPMLVLNSLLDSEFLYKSANYPDQIETCLASVPHYASTYHRVLLFLSKVAANMHDFDATVKERGFPPLIEEMVAVFAVPSGIVQHVIYTAYCRVLIGEREGKDAWLVEYEVVHKQNQKLYEDYLRQRARILAMQRQNREEQEQEQSAAMLEQLGVASSRDRQKLATMYSALREEMLKGATPAGKGEWAVVLFAAQQKNLAREGRRGSSSGGNTSSASSQSIPVSSTAAAAAAAARVVSGPPRQQQHQQQPRQREQQRARTTAAAQQQQQRMQSTRIQPPSSLVTSFPATAPTTATAPMQVAPPASAPNWPTRPHPHPHLQQPSQLLTSASNALAALQNTAIAMPPQHQQQQLQLAYAHPHPVTVSTARAAQQATIAAREAAAAQRHVRLVQQPQPQQPQVQPPAPLAQQSGLLMHMPTALPYHTRQNLSQALVQVQPQQEQEQQPATTTTATTTAAAATALERMMATLPNEVRAPLLPPSNVHPTLWANPRPRFIALHEAHLAYNSRPVNSEGKIDRDIELFQYFETFMIPPKQLDNKFPTVTWTIDVSADLFRKLPIPTAEPSIGGEPLWALQDGKKMLQLRCIKDPKGRMTSDHRWAVAETAWPDSTGKIYPLNLTPFLTEGRNHLQITVLHDLTPRPSKPQPQFMAAVEIIDTASRKRVRNMVRSLSATKSLSDIQKRLNASIHASAALNSDEICLVDDDITIDLVDPFTAVVFQTPVRGTSCSHRECFDLDTYLLTRLTRAGVNKVSAEKMAEGEGMPEEWKCPICGQDARPRSLMIDGFLVEVRRKLVAEGRLDARAVRVKKDGTWEVKVRVEGTVVGRKGVVRAMGNGGGRR